MSEYNEGDKLTIVPRTIGINPVTQVFGVLVKERENEWTIRPDGIRYAYDFNMDDWVISGIEKVKPKVELPTESGYYAGFDEVADTEILVMVSTAGRIYLPNASKHLGVGDLIGDPERFAPYVKLEPRTVTAKAVLDEVGKFAWADGFTAQIEAVAKKFGVTS